MPTIKAAYEAVFIYSLTQGEEGLEALKEKFRALIEQNAEIGEVDEWGKRKLAYLINDLDEGYYVLMTFTADPAFPAELDRKMRIETGIMRSIIISKEA